MIPLTRNRLRQGEVVLIGGLRHKLLRLFGESAWQTEIETTREIKVFERSELLRLWCSGGLVFPEDWRDPKLNDIRKQLVRAKAEQALPEDTKRRQAYVMAVLDLPRTDAAVRLAIQEVGRRRKETKPPHPATVLKWRRRFERAGSDPLALFERNDLKGRQPATVHPDLDAAVRLAIAGTYMQRMRNSLAHTREIAEALVQEKNQELLENGCDKSELIPAPTLYLVRREVARIPAYDRCVARKGRDEANRQFRSTKQHYVVRGPLHLAEMDSTPVDAFIVDGRTLMPLGRPYVTACLEVYTRALLGLHISFDPPSYRSVAQCLRHALMPKVDMKFDGVQIVNPWFAYGTMYHLSVDNGREFHSNAFEAVCFANFIELGYAQRRTGWHKPHIERYLKTQSHGFIHTLPGTTFSNVIERGDYDSKKGAVLTLDDFRAQLYRWVCDYYHMTAHTSTGVTPRTAWENSISDQDIPLLAAPINMTPFIGYRDRRVLDENGVQLKGLQFNGPGLTALRNRYGERLSVDLRWDSEDLGRIWVMHPDEPEPIEARALDYEYADGLTLFQHDTVLKYVRQVMKRENTNGSRLQAKLAIQRQIEDAMGHAGRSGRYKSGGLPINVKVGRFTQGGTGSRLSVPDGLDDDVRLTPVQLVEPETKESTSTKVVLAAITDKPAAPRKPKTFSPIYNGTVLTGDDA